MNNVIVIKTEKTFQYHLDQLLHKHVVYKEIIHIFIPPVKEHNQPHKSILTVVPTPDTSIMGFFTLIQAFRDPFMSMLHNGFIRLSKPRSGSTCPNIIPHSPFPPWEGFTLSPGMIISLSTVVLKILYGHLFAQAFVPPTVFLAGWDSYTTLNAESFSNLVIQVKKFQ